MADFLDTTAVAARGTGAGSWRGFGVMTASFGGTAIIRPGGAVLGESGLAGVVATTGGVMTGGGIGMAGMTAAAMGSAGRVRLIRTTRAGFGRTARARGIGGASISGTSKAFRGATAGLIDALTRLVLRLTEGVETGRAATRGLRRATDFFFAGLRAAAGRVVTRVSFVFRALLFLARAGRLTFLVVVAAGDFRFFISGDILLSFWFLDDRSCVRKH